MNHTVAIQLAEAAPPRPMSILQIGDGWFPECIGGAQHAFYQIARLLPLQDVDVRGLVIGSPKVAEETNSRVIGFAPRTASLPARLLAARRAVRDAFRTYVPDAVVSHFALFTFPALDIIGRTKLVVHFHGPWAEESKVEGANPLAVAVMRHIEQAVYRRADRVLVHSKSFADIAQHDYGVRPERIRLIPAGVDCARFTAAETQAEARRALGWSEQGPILLAVRRLARRMGLDNLIAAVGELRQRHPDLRLYIAGDGEMRAALEQQIQLLGLSDRVELCGRLTGDRLPLAYRAADLTVVPSYGLEGFGLITVESLAMGTPVLVTPVGGMPEVVAPLSPNLVLRGTGVGDLVAGLDAALDGSLELPDAQTCAHFARSNFDWAAIATRMRAAYRDTLG